jgi:hypothetical protein
MRECFSAHDRRAVSEAERLASDLVTRFYAIAPREWGAMRYEVRTLGQLEPEEVHDDALAHVLCYDVRKTVGGRLVHAGELFRICVQDHRLLHHHRAASLPLRPLLLYVLTHELVHVVRFGQRLQDPGLPRELRPGEEARVDHTARTILRGAGVRGLGAVLERFDGCGDRAPSADPPAAGRGREGDTALGMSAAASTGPRPAARDA